MSLWYYTSQGLSFHKDWPWETEWYVACIVATVADNEQIGLQWYQNTNTKCTGRYFSIVVRYHYYWCDCVGWQLTLFILHGESVVTLLLAFPKQSVLALSAGEISYNVSHRMSGEGIDSDFPASHPHRNPDLYSPSGWFSTWARTLFARFGPFLTTRWQPNKYCRIANGCYGNRASYSR